MVEIVLPHYYRLSRLFSNNFKKWLISWSNWFGFIISSMDAIAFSVFSPLCDSNEEESRYWGKSFHLNQGEATKADKVILSFTPGFQRRNHNFASCDPQKSPDTPGSPEGNTEGPWKNQVLNVSAQFPEIYPAASWEEMQGTVCDLNDYRAQIRAHLSISGWPPQACQRTLKLPRCPCGYWFQFSFPYSLGHLVEDLK